MNLKRRLRKPTSPGEILKEELLVAWHDTKSNWQITSGAMSKSSIGS